MARTVTLQTLQNRVLQRCNLKASTANLQILDAGELNDDINEGIAAMWSLIASVDTQPYYLESTTFNTSANTDTYGIGSGQPINVTDYYKVRGFDVMFGQNIVITARPFMWSERNRFKWYPGWIYSQPVFYRMLGKASGPANAALDSVKFIPAPSGQFNITMWYVPTPPVLANLSDALDGINGFEEYAVLDAAIKLLVKQEQLEHAQVLMARRQEEKDRILGDLQVRDAENPERVQDVTLNDGWIGRPGY